MGWIGVLKTGKILKEEDGVGRPVEIGNEGGLAAIAQADFGHQVAVDLINGLIHLDYETIGIQNGTLDISGAKAVFHICEETNKVGNYKHLKQEFVDFRDDQGRKVLGEDGRYVKVRNDILTDLTWRAIWFTRVIGGMPTKIIGAQVTTPELQGSKNIKCLVSLFSDGSIGISS